MTSVESATFPSSIQDCAPTQRETDTFLRRFPGLVHVAYHNFSKRRKAKQIPKQHSITSATKQFAKTESNQSSSSRPPLVSISSAFSNHRTTMASPSHSSSVVRQELLSAVVVAGRTSTNSTVSISTATNNASSSGIAPPDAATGRPAIHHYGLLREEPSTGRVLQPRRRICRGGNARQNEGTKNSFLAPRQSEVHILAIAPDILREVERQLQEEAEALIRQEEES